MKYKKYSMGSYQLHTICTNKFKTITIRVNFKREVTKDEITIRNLLADILLKSTKKYHTERLMNIIVEDLYGMNFTGYTTISGRYNIISFDFTFLSEKYTEKGILEKTICFLTDLLFEPNVEKGKFNEGSFRQSKNMMKLMIESLKEDPDRYSLTRALEEMDDQSPSSFRTDGYIEDLKRIDEGNLYQYYKSVITKDILDIFVIGDIDSQIREMIASKFSIHTFKKQSKTHYITDAKTRFRSKKVKEESTYNQSKLVIGANLVGMTPFEREYVSYVYSFILGGGADSNLFKNLREEHSLCYYISSQIYRLNGLLMIRLGLDKQNIPKAITLIKKELKKMEKGNFSDEDLMKSQVTYVSSLKEVMDHPHTILNLYVSREYLHLDLLEERILKIGKVTRKQVQAFAKKVKINTIYALEGTVANEEKSIE